MRLILIILWIHISSSNSFEPTWESLDSRVTPGWFDEAKIGILIHYGIYSVTVSSEWFWKGLQQEDPELLEYMKLTKPPGFTYQDYANEFKAELFDVGDWVNIFADAGAKYVIITAKHHDGFTLYPSSYSSYWNSVDIGPHVDFLGDLSQAVRESNTSMKFGIYYSLMEWFHPLYMKDKNASTDEFVTHKILPELSEIINLYAPDIVWADGDWEMTDDYWKSKDFLSWLFNNSSVKDTVVVNDRWGRGTMCKHGSYLTCHDRYNPKTLQAKKFENVLSLVKNTWGFDPMTTLDSILTTKELIRHLITTVSCNGNLLISVGPNKDGRIENIYTDRLKEFGKWVKINGEGIYGSRPWTRQNSGDDVWFTMKETHRNQSQTYIFVFVLEYPFVTNSVVLRDVGFLKADPVIVINLLGYDKKINFSMHDEDLIIEFPDKRLIDQLNLSLAWTFKMTLIK